MDNKISVKKTNFDKFLNNFKKGKFKNKRLGEAAYEYFKWDKVVDQTKLFNIHAKDGEHAIACMKSFLKFT